MATRPPRKNSVSPLRDMRALCNVFRVSISSQPETAGSHRRRSRADPAIGPLSTFAGRHGQEHRPTFLTPIIRPRTDQPGSTASGAGRIGSPERSPHDEHASSSPAAPVRRRPRPCPGLAFRLRTFRGRHGFHGSGSVGAVEEALRRRPGREAAVVCRSDRMDHAPSEVAIIP